MLGFKTVNPFKSGPPVKLKGTKPSMKANTLLISSGNSSLDQLFGGGLSIGSLILIEEDVAGVYSKLLLRYFLAEAVLTDQSIALISADENPTSLLNTLPDEIVFEDPLVISESSSPSDNMKIAWRYKNMTSENITSKPAFSTFSHAFDLSKSLDTGAYQTTDKCHTCYALNDDMSSSHEENTVSQAISFLLNTINKGYDLKESNPNKNVLRIGVHSCGSPMWNASSEDFISFVFAVRSIVKSSLATAMITVPRHFFQDGCLGDRLRHLSDYCLGLESFAGSDKATNPAYADYHGLVDIYRLPIIKSLEPAERPRTLDLAFKVTRKKLIIEALHLPPDLSETVSRSTHSTGCGSTSTGVKIDF